ncbi:MAG TPA: protein kinase [Blastocatellia bacterium]|nr:protein kinase [Blastocatellia bacterium]
MEQRPKRDPYGLVGTTIADRYKVEELVGIGGMGVVYRAQHVMTTATVALKVLKPDLAIAYPDMVESFFKEAKATVGLDHPYIIKVTDAAVTADGIPFLVMEWLDGRTLEAEIRDKGMLPLDRVATLIEQVCEALAQAHARGIVHRDLKPGNIMLVTDYKGEEAVKILDFGIAKAMSTTTGAKVSRAIGTLHYASPEQLMLGASIDHRSDIYSLGVILYQLLTGQVPFDADSMERMIYQHLKVEPPPLRALRPDLSEAVESVVLKALAKNPAERYQSATDLARALRRAISLETGTLILRCLDQATREPVAGVSVYLNGKYAGQTDETGCWRKDDCLPKSHVVETDGFGYHAWRATVRIEPRKEASLTAELTAIRAGELIITCGIAGAEVLVDEKTFGVTDHTGRFYLDRLPVGKHTVRVVHPTHRPATSEVEIIEGEKSELHLSLVPDARRHFAQKTKAIAQAITTVMRGNRRAPSPSVPQKEPLAPDRVEDTATALLPTERVTDTEGATQHLAPTVAATRMVPSRRIFVGMGAVVVVVILAGGALLLLRPRWFASKEIGQTPTVGQPVPSFEMAPPPSAPIPAPNPPLVSGQPLGTPSSRPAGKAPSATSQGRPSPGAQDVAATSHKPEAVEPMLTAKQHIDRGNAYLNSGRTQAALLHYQDAQRLEPNNPDVYYLLGLAYERLGDIEAAIKAFEQCTSGPYAGVAQSHVKRLQKKKGK